MIKEWIINVLATVPVYGNVVKIPYKAKASDKKYLTANFVKIKIDLDDRGIEDRSLLITDSDINEFTSRFTKYDVGDFKPVAGKFSIKACTQISTMKRAKPVVQQLILGGIRHIDDKVDELWSVALTKGQYNSMYQRYLKAKDKLHYTLSLKQRLALFLNSIFGIIPDMEVYAL